MKRYKLKLEILPKVLKALRNSSGYTVEEIAKKLKTDAEKVKDAEEGKISFTLTQIKKLADIYKRPLAAFFSDVPPKIPYVLKDYRINREKRLTPQVRFAERRAYYLSSKIAELSGKESKIPTFPDHLKADELARAFKKYLNIELKKAQKPEEILAYYKNVLEENLSISIIEYPLKADDVRAFSISPKLSIIVLNEQDSPSIKLFSLFHEVCHLLKRNSGICSIEIEQEDQEKIESFCNLFSAEFLVPLDNLKNEIKRLSSLDRNGVSELSKLYGVSKQVTMIRLLWLGYIEKERYDRFKRSLEELKRKGFGRINWEKRFYNRVGNLAIKEVSDSYQNGRISFSEVIDVLNMKSKYAEKFIAP